uniref:Uncharacterized protein n=1 Tax=Arabidopsis thaliana TaxID=3702 RepID=Q0WMD5_ARATH|nr:hypothetical protein [Arabidopsis thaliana]
MLCASSRTTLNHETFARGPDRNSTFFFFEPFFLESGGYFLFLFEQKPVAAVPPSCTPSFSSSSSSTRGCFGTSILTIENVVTTTSYLANS